MANQEFYVAKGLTVRGPLTERKRATTNDGRVVFSGKPGIVYAEGTLLPAGYVDYARSKKETNGQTLLQNLIDTGFVVFTPNTRSPLADMVIEPTPSERHLNTAGQTIAVGSGKKN